MKRLPQMPHWLVLSVLALVFVVGCATNPVTNRKQTRLLSPEAEKKIGQETKKQILEQYRVLDSTTVTSYVNRVGQRLAQVSDRPTVDYDFTVLDSDLINAFAAPGGYVFVTRGLLDAVNDEAELAMVLGHEIGHVAALHGVQEIQREMGQNALTILGSIGAAIVAGPEAMLMVANSASLFSSLYLLGYSRENELQADNLGVQYLLRAGYDPQASVRFLKNLEKMGDENVHGWDLYFRTHPKTSDRLKIIEAMIGSKEEDSAVRNAAEYEAIKSLLPRPEPRERGQIVSHIYKNSVHHLTVSVPPNWEMGFYHPQALVSFQTKNGEAEGRLFSVILGSTTKTSENLAYRFGKDSGFETQSGREILYGAGYGWLGRYMGVSPGGKLLDIRLFATIRHGRGYIIMAGADPEKSDSYALDLERILRSLKFDDTPKPT